MRGASYTQEQLGTGYQIRATGSRFSYVYWIFNDTEPEDTGGVLFFAPLFLFFPPLIFNDTEPEDTGGVLFFLPALFFLSPVHFQRY